MIVVNFRKYSNLFYYECIHFRLLSGKSTFISPKIWLAKKILQNSRKKTKNRIVHIEMGKRPPIQKKKWRLFNERIDCLKLSLTLGNKDLKNYWNTMCLLRQKC